MSIDLSLDRLARLLPHLPLQYRRPTIHIAGTNGKGSVSAIISSILLSSSPPLKVGRYNSPHLVSINDCITIDDQIIDFDLYQQARQEVERINSDQGTSLSLFELLTMTALQIFERAQVDVAVVEVGMGGRLDATNIIPSECILVSALTSVDFDHQAFLGNTIEAIAREKAAIARPGKPFVLGRQSHEDEVNPVVQQVVDSVNGVLLPSLSINPRSWDELTDGPQPSSFSLPSSPSVIPFQPPPPRPVKVFLPCFNQNICALLPLYGAHQLDNLGTALGIVDALLIYHSACSETSLNFRDRVTLETVKNGIGRVKWRGRLCFHTIDIPMSDISGHHTARSEKLVVLVDGAHNPASSTTLSHYITHLIDDLLLRSSDGSVPNKRSKLDLTLTYILALSHSPPKTPFQTLAPLLPPRLPSSFDSSSATLATSSVSRPNPDLNFKIDLNVAVVPFTPPDSMPWVKPVPSSELASVVRQLVPDSTNIWLEDDSNRPGVDRQFGKSDEQLERVLEWAAGQGTKQIKEEMGAGRDDDGSGDYEGDRQVVNLVVLAGSLYLVADFYRLLEKRGRDADADVALNDLE